LCCTSGQPLLGTGATTYVGPTGCENTGSEAPSDSSRSVAVPTRGQCQVSYPPWTSCNPQDAASLLHGPGQWRLCNIASLPVTPRARTQPALAPIMSDPSEEAVQDAPPAGASRADRRHYRGVTYGTYAARLSCRLYHERQPLAAPSHRLSVPDPPYAVLLQTSGVELGVCASRVSDSNTMLAGAAADPDFSTICALLNPLSLCVMVPAQLCY
jgi:hypothetical protein